MRAIVMRYQLLPPCMFGFLLTVFPRWMNLPALTSKDYAPVGMGLFSGQAPTLVALCQHPMALHLGLSAAPRRLLMSLFGWFQIVGAGPPSILIAFATCLGRSSRFFQHDEGQTENGNPVAGKCCIHSGFLYLNRPVQPEEPKISVHQVDAGRRLWQQHDCNACHQVYGLGGNMGPDLTNVYTKGGAAYIKAFLNSGTTVMPRFELSEAEKDQLVGYLQHLDASGRANPTTFKAHSDGTISQ